MNALGFLLLGVVARVTVLAALGSALEALVRRRSPAAGSLAALGSLTGLVAITALSLSPWPQFWTIDLETVPADSVAAINRPAPDPSAAAPDAVAAPVAASGTDLARAAEFTRALLRAVREPSVAAVPGSSPKRAVSWRWPAWVAVGLLAAWAAGLMRLALALTALRGLHRRSRPIVDAGLLVEVERLGPALGLARPVDVRVSDELSAPATVGWLRPVLLLPSDWPRWDDSERLAVLAHELAHVRRSDYLSSLWAQLCLALHIYHPLAHWLVARLRLDQELLADAWGAQLAGGSRPYLQVLARLALRRSEPPAARLAQPFLPGRNAFLRRIQMLRDAQNTPMPTGPLPRPARWLTAASLAVLTLAVAGLRGPAGFPEARAQAPQPPAIDQKAQLQKQIRELDDRLRQIERAEAAKGGAALHGAFDLSRAPADTVMAVVARPADLVGRDEFKPLRDLIKDPSFQRVGGNILAPEVLWFAVLFTRSGGREGIVKLMCTNGPAAVALQDTKPEGRLNGQAYYRRESNAKELLYVVDDHTLAIGSDEAVFALIQARAVDRPIPHPWDAAWAKLAPKGQAAVAFDASWLAASLPKTPLPGSPQDPLSVIAGSITPLFEKATGYAAGLSVDPTLQAEAVATCPSAEDAAAVRETATALITLGKNSVHSLALQPARANNEQGEAERTVFKILESILADAKPVSEPADSDRVVRVRARTDQDAASIARTVLPLVITARAQAREAQCMINLKQIGLAMHNYYSANDHFPPAVVIGPDGKTPHSWRVELLPYLEPPTSLYQKYHMNEPWDSPANRKVLEQMPAVFRSPTDTRQGCFTSYFVPVGAETIFPPGGKGTPIEEILDGTSNTLLTVEAKRDVPWTKPEDIAVPPRFDSRVPALGGFEPDSFLAGMADGSVRRFPQAINPVVLKALFSRASGEVINFDAIRTPQR